MLVAGLFHFAMIPHAYSQKMASPPQKIGFNYGYGSQFTLNVNYAYRAHLFQLQYYSPIFSRNNFALEMVAQPQYNLTSFNNTAPKIFNNRGYELGFNLGILARKHFLEKSGSLYILVSSGPHYVSGVPSRQAKGFIFSDNILCGITIKTGSSTWLDFRNGIRHISNASVKQPNAGINNFVTSVGFCVDVNGLAG